MIVTFIDSFGVKWAVRATDIRDIKDDGSACVIYLPWGTRVSSEKFGDLVARWEEATGKARGEVYNTIYQQNPLAPPWTIGY